MQNHAEARISLLFLLYERVEPVDVGAPVALFRRYGVRHYLVVEQVHVEGQLPILPRGPERGHVADDDLHRRVDLHVGEKQVGIYLRPVRRLVAAEPLRLALYAAALAAAMGVGIGENLAGVEPNLGVKPPIPVRRVELVVLRERRLRQLPSALRLAGVLGIAAPLVEAAPVDAHRPAYALDGEIPRQYVDYLELEFPSDMNSFSAPPPFTVYPFHILC